MYDLRPFKCYLLDTVQKNALAMARVKRILSALDIALENVSVFSETEAVDVIREINDWAPPQDGLIPWQHQRALLFTTIRIDEQDRAEPVPKNVPDDVSRSLLGNVLGHINLVRDTHAPADDELRNLVCWNTQDFGVMHGCPHGCQYCGVGKSSKVTIIGANLEEYMDKVVGPTVEKHPGQRCFRLIGWGADITTFEPEYGAFELFLNKLSEYDERYGYFHTAGNNVDWITDLPHRDRLIGIWSLTCESAAKHIEPGSPSNSERIAAAKTCEALGVPVRFKFKPTIPVKNWREEYADTIEAIFRETTPESLGFCVLMWMTFEQLAKRIVLDLLDPEFVAAARQGANDLATVRTGPFPHPLRAAVYRHLIRETRQHNPRIPIYISTESREMWDELKEELEQNPRSFVCGCNPIEIPGPRMMRSESLAYSTYPVNKPQP